MIWLGWCIVWASAVGGLYAAYLLVEDLVFLVVHLALAVRRRRRVADVAATTIDDWGRLAWPSKR